MPVTAWLLEKLTPPMMAPTFPPSPLLWTAPTLLTSGRCEILPVVTIGVWLSLCDVISGVRVELWLVTSGAWVSLLDVTSGECVWLTDATVGEWVALRDVTSGTLVTLPLCVAIAGTLVAEVL